MKKSISPMFVVIVLALFAFAIYFWLLPLLYPPFISRRAPTDNTPLAEKVKSKLGMDLTDLENSLALTPIVTGEEPFILTYTVPSKVEAATMGGYSPSNQLSQTRLLMLLDNGHDAHGCEINRQTNGAYLVQWNTTFASYGMHTLQACLCFPWTGAKRVDGPKQTETVTNILQWEYDGSGFGRRTNFRGFLHVPSADYSIQIYDTNKVLMKRIDGHADNGIINEFWDSHPTNKYAWTDEDLKAVAYITPTITDTNGQVKSNAPTVCVPYP